MNNFKTSSYTKKKMSLKGMKLVTFDATNTLLKFRQPPWQHYAAVARNFGFKGTEEDVKRRLLYTYKAMWNKYPNFGRDIIGWEDWWSRVISLTFEGQMPENVNMQRIANKLINDFKTSKCWSAASGTERLINLIRRKGIQIGVISNFDPRLHVILQNINMHDYFNFVLTSYDIGYSKPDQRIFCTAIERCGNLVQPCECIHIGDDIEKDYLGAQSAGWHALVVSDKLNTENSLKPEHVFKNLTDLTLDLECDSLRL